MVSFLEHGSTKTLVVMAFLNPMPNLCESHLAIGWIVNEAILLDCRSNALFKIISPDEGLIKMERNCEAGRDGEAGQSRVNNLAEICGLCAKADGITRPLKPEIREPVVIEIGAGRNQVAALDPLPIAFIDLTRVGRHERKVVLAHF